VENNKWAIGMAHDRASSQTEIYKKASVFGMPGYEVDGMDVLAVRGVAEEAVRRARAGEGPTLIEALTYRFRGHSLADPDELRSKEEKELWQARDPIKQLARYMTKHQLAEAADFKTIEQKIQAHVEDAVEFAIASPEPDPADLYKYVFAEN
jgi:pyruvate dehydrogenase E1 component alpha subunit